MIENAVTQDTFVEYDHRDESETYFIVPATIGPEDGRHLFSYLGVFLTYITPRDLTVGMNFLLLILIERFFCSKWRSFFGKRLKKNEKKNVYE